MHGFFQIIKYVLPYKFLLIIASIFSILYSISNGLTIYSIVPIFDTLSKDEKPFTFSISDYDLNILSMENLTVIDHVKYLQIRIKQKINSYFLTTPKDTILITVSLLIIPLVLIRGLFDFIAKFLFSYAGNKTILDIRNELFSHIIKVPFRFFHKNRSGEIISRLTRDVIPLTSAVSTNLYEFVSGIILLITNIAILSIINWKMVIFILILIPFIYFPITFLGNYVKKYTKKIQEGFADISSHLEETFSGIKVIKSFNMESYENDKFNSINNSIFSKDLKRRIYQNLNPSVVELLGAIAIASLFIYGGYQIIHGYITSGEFIFFMLIVLNLFEPVKNISEAVNGTKAGEAASARINKLYEYPQEIFFNGKDGSFSRKVELKNLSFKYNKDYVLKDINLKIPKGKTIGIAGASGSGKSTILNLLTSFYFPFKGEITFDDMPGNDLTLNWIRERIAYVTQDVFLFHGTVLENLTCGKSTEMSKVIQAAQMAHAHEFILAMPQGYDTIVGERGALLSGGERQRISIARAILADPDIILFDEATSALDSESEKLIQDSLNFLFKNRTSVIVSHRLSTIQHADIIYYLENGTILESGTHDELFMRNEGYRALFSY